jgi:hypothetical protein
MAPEQKKSNSELLIESLGRFIQEQATLSIAPKPAEKVTSRQYLSLVLFCCNVIILYLTINTIFSTFTQSPVWQLFGQVAPVAVGSSFIVAKSEEMQKWLMKLASHLSFLASMIIATVFLGGIGMTQVRHFQVPVTMTTSATQFCAEEVEDLEDVVSAVGRKDPMPNKQCTGGRFQSKGERHLKHLRLGKGYMITVKGQQSTLDRYYLSGGEVLKRSVGLKQSALSLETVTLTVHINYNEKNKKQTTSSNEKNIRIQTTGSPDLIYVPEGCWLDEKAPTITTCTLKNGVFSMQLMPGSYFLLSDDQSCRTQEKQPLELKIDEQIEMECN